MTRVGACSNLASCGRAGCACVAGSGLTGAGVAPP